MNTVLIIEDEPQIRENIQEILDLEGFVTIAAENGRHGLQMVEECQPDVIICDVMMPELDGYGVLTQLRQNNSTATIPLIFLTAKSEWSDLRKGMELGADDYLTKPFLPDELLQAITTRLEKKAIAEEHTQEKLNDLSSCISHAIPHEINTPLGHILGISKVLIDDYELFSQEETLEMLGMIHEAGLRLHKLTLNFLMYADLELIASNHEKVTALRNDRVTAYVKSIIENTALKFAHQFNRKGDLRLDISEAMVKISPSKLNKIVEEIIDNAFKFSNPNTPIKIIGNSNNNAFYLYIIDYGRGITQEQIAGIRAYVQFERKIYEQQGSGLGLSIAKMLVELHGGEFSIESIPGKQTIVRIVLPQ